MASIISLIAMILMFHGVVSHPVHIQDEDIETNTINIEDQESVTDSMIYEDEEDDYDALSTTTITPQLSQKPPKMIILKTFIFDGPLIVGKVQPVMLSERISIFSRFIITDEDTTDSESLIIDDSDECTTITS